MCACLQTPDLEQLSRLQGLFQCEGVPPLEFVEFLMALAIAPDLKGHPGATSTPSKSFSPGRASSMDCSYQPPAGTTDAAADSGSVHNGSWYQPPVKEALLASKTSHTGGQMHEADHQPAAAAASAAFGDVSKAATKGVCHSMLSDDGGAASDDNGGGKRRRTNGGRQRNSHPGVNVWASSLTLMRQLLGAAHNAAAATHKSQANAAAGR